MHVAEAIVKERKGYRDQGYIIIICLHRLETIVSLDIPRYLLTRFVLAASLCFIHYPAYCRGKSLFCVRVSIRMASSILTTLIFISHFLCPPLFFFWCELCFRGVHIAGGPTKRYLSLSVKQKTKQIKNVPQVCRPDACVGKPHKQKGKVTCVESRAGQA